MPYRRDPEGVERAVLRSLLSVQGQHVLEIGCGDGRVTWMYADDAASVLALDPDQAAIEQAQRVAEAGRANIIFQTADITTMELPQQAFDVAIFSWSM